MSSGHVPRSPPSTRCSSARITRLTLASQPAASERRSKKRRGTTTRLRGRQRSRPVRDKKAATTSTNEQRDRNSMRQTMVASFDGGATLTDSDLLEPLGRDRPETQRMAVVKVRLHLGFAGSPPAV